MGSPYFFRSIISFLGIVLVSAASLSQAFVDKAEKKPKPAADSVKKDYKDELPRIAPTAPSEAVKTFQVKPGFRMELVVSEPLIRDPVAIDFDENGRMFVVEMPEYNQYANPKGSNAHGVVKRLEDTNEDGRFDKASIYVDNLDTPGAVACYDGGIFVGAVPDILYCKDTDGDGKADVRKRVFTGFARDPAGEAMLNSFRWSFDNRFHISTNLAGGNVKRADAEKTKPVSVRGRGFIFDPRSSTFELTSGGGQHGMSMDDWGRKFVCSNSNPAQTLMYDGRYLARNPYLEAPSAAVTIAPQGKFTKLFRISPVEPWRKLRTRLRSKGLVRGSDEGGKPSGFFTGATGITVYRGHAWPDEYRGNLIVGDVSNNIVYRARVEPNGVGVTAIRADEGAEFVASKDIWFRPVQFAHAPDGNLYVIDMSRELIEGAAFLPPQILKHLDVSSGMDRGRIYRIVHEDFKQPKLPRLGNATTNELVSYLEHRNGWHRDTASRLIYERQDRAAVAPLRKLAVESKFAQGRMHAMYALDGLQAVDETTLLNGLADRDANVRQHAIRLAEKQANSSPAVRAKLIVLADDSDRNVRYQLAFSLGALPVNQRLDALAKLIVRDGADQWFQLAALSSSNHAVGELFRLLSSDEKYRHSNIGRKFLVTLAAQIGKANRRDEIAAVLKSLDELPVSEKSLAETVVQGLVTTGSADVKKQLANAAGGKAAAILDNLLQDAKTTAVDKKAEIAARASAIRTLGLAKFSDVENLLGTLVDLRQPQAVQLAAIETLGKFDNSHVAGILLKAWSGLSPQPRSRAAEVLLSRPNSIEALFDALEEGTIGRGDVDPSRIKLLASHPDITVRTRAKKLLAGQTVARRKDVVARYQKSLGLQGEVMKGKALFKKVCSACHKLEGVGNVIGADLKAIRDRGTEAVLLNILDPNREVKPQFLTYVVATTEGQVVTGMIIAETANNITIRRNDGKNVTVLRVDIDELRSTGLSFMPEGLEKQIDLQAMSDLLAYLNSIR